MTCAIKTLGGVRLQRTFSKNQVNKNFNRKIIVIKLKHIRWKDASGQASIVKNKFVRSERSKDTKTTLEIKPDTSAQRTGRK